MRKAIKAGLRPDRIMTVSEWADTYRKLNSMSAAMSGKYRISVTPFLKDIADALSEYSPVEEVIVMKGAQVGMTEVALNWIGYTVQVSPCPILLVEPTKEVVELVSTTRIAPMLEDTPELAAIVKPAKSRSSSNTMTKKEFPGGILRLAGANSAAGLRNMPVKRLILDEVDAYPLDLDGEGDPIDLAKKRTSTFANRKIFILSTPTTKGVSVIEPLFESTDQRYYYVPCPHCGGMQDLRWQQLRYDYDSRAKVAKNVRYECIHCGGGIPERHKTEMLANGKWVVTAPENENQKRIGFHLSALYSPLGWRSWSDLAADWEAAQHSTPKLKTFYNTELGLTYEEMGEKPQWEALQDRSGEYAANKIPTNDIAFLTAGVDVQKDRLEVQIVGWCEGKISYSIDYRVLMGYVSGDGSSEVWKRLAELLKETWAKPDGTLLSIRQMCVDSGSFTSEVYAFCLAQKTPKVVPIKGRDKQATVISAPKAVNVTRKNKSVGGVKVWHVGVSMLKDELYGWLRLTPGENGYCHFPRYGETFFQGLVSEEKVITKNKKGHDVETWVKKFARNEPLDTRIYARAAAHMVGLDSMGPEQWAALRRSGAGPQPVKKVKKRKSNFL